MALYQNSKDVLGGIIVEHDDGPHFVVTMEFDTMFDAVASTYTTASEINGMPIYFYDQKEDRARPEHVRRYADCLYDSRGRRLYETVSDFIDDRPNQ